MIGEYLAEKIKSDSKLSSVSAYFTIYAYQQLKEQLDGSNNLRFLFGEPAFIKSLGGDINNQRSANILDETNTISVQDRLFQRNGATPLSVLQRHIRDVADYHRQRSVGRQLHIQTKVRAVA